MWLMVFAPSGQGHDHSPWGKMRRWQFIGRDCLWWLVPESRRCATYGISTGGLRSPGRIAASGHQEPFGSDIRQAGQD